MSILYLHITVSKGVQAGLEQKIGPVLGLVFCLCYVVHVRNRNKYE